MTEKKLSTLGYLMDRLGLSTAGLARRLHVDASLVSKWRSGNRRLHVKSFPDSPGGGKGAHGYGNPLKAGPD